MLLPAFDPELILGTDFDAFRRSPAHQRKLLGSGRRLGTIVQWLDRTANVIRTIQGSARGVGRGGEISKGNGSLSQRTEEPASNLEETASSME